MFKVRFTVENSNIMKIKSLGVYYTGMWYEPEP